MMIDFLLFQVLTICEFVKQSSRFPIHVVVNDSCSEPNLIRGTNLNTNGMGLRFVRKNVCFKGLRRSRALDVGGAWQGCLPP